MALLGGLFRGGLSMPSPGFAAALPLEILGEGLKYLQGFVKEGGRLLTYWVPLAVPAVGLLLLACPNPVETAREFRPGAGKAVLTVLCLVLSVILFSGVDTFIYENF